MELQVLSPEMSKALEDARNGTKLKIVFRKNLKMSPGKLAAQAVHAAIGLGCTDAIMSVVVLGVSDAKYKKIAESTPDCYRNHDAGYTEVEPGTETCLAFYEPSTIKPKE